MRCRAAFLVLIPPNPGKAVIIKPSLNIGLLAFVSLALGRYPAITGNQDLETLSLKMTFRLKPFCHFFFYPEDTVFTRLIMPISTNTLFVIL